jgi:hypothetical protein
MLRGLMESRAPCPGRFHGLEGPRVRQVCKAPVRPVAHHRQNDLRNHRETLLPLVGITPAQVR